VSDCRAIRYNCVQSLSSGLFRVATADFIEHPPPHRDHHQLYFVGAIAWDPADPEQPDWHETLEAAVAAHDAEFENWAWS